MPRALEPSFLDLCQSTMQQSAVELWLGGGLGDQLECLAQLHDPVLNAWMPCLHLRLPPHSRAALQPFLEAFWPKQGPSWTFVPASAEAADQPVWFSQMGWACLLGQAGLQPKPQVLQLALCGSVRTSQLAVLLASKIDPDDRHWAHLRSWPFPRNCKVVWAFGALGDRRGIRLIDITAYRSDERQTLSRHSPTLKLIQPEIRSLSNTAALLCQPRRDQRGYALVHLSAWFGWPTLLLLHQYPDERWSHRPLGLDQTHPIKVLRQTRYNSWRGCRRHVAFISGRLALAEAQ